MFQGSTTVMPASTMTALVTLLRVSGLLASVLSQLSTEPTAAAPAPGCLPLQLLHTVRLPCMPTLTFCLHVLPAAGASRCAPGFYSAKGSRKPCQQCPQGRTTADNPALQRVVTDCFVMAGFGVVNTTSNATDPYNPTTDGGMLPVLDCPVGEHTLPFGLG